MKRCLVIWAIALVSLIVAGCVAKPTRQTPPDALGRLPARYQGQLPCADCAGIRTVLSIYPDHVFAMEMTYLGTVVTMPPPAFFEIGRWQTDQNGHTLRLLQRNGRPAQIWHIAGSGRLEKRGIDNQPIESDLDYSLDRTGMPLAPSLGGTYWRLIRLDGQRVARVHVTREPHLVFHAGSSRVAGAAGCNRLRGRYSRDDARLSLARLAVTRKACVGPTLNLEQRFLTTLRAVDSYRVLERHLVVYAASGQRLAVFAATPMD